MVKHKGLCPSLKKSVEFDVKEIIELPTKRGIKYQVKGDFEGRTCSTFCSKAKAMELKKALGLDVMDAESEDGTGQAHQEEGVSPIENNVQPLAQGQEPMESMPVQETVSTPITNTSIGVEPIENLDLTDADALNNMTTEFDEAPQMVADIEIAPSEPEGDGRSIGNISPMNEDVPLHAESEDGTGQAHQEEGVSPIENNVQPLAQGQEPMEAMPVQETVSTPITNTSIGVEPIDNLGLDGGADVIGSMITEFDDAPEILANFQIGMMQPFGEGRSIGNNTPMNPDVPLHAEEFKAEAEIEIIDPTDNTTLPTPPPVCFVDKIPPSVWENLSVLEKIHYAETGDESILICPNCGISKEQLRLQDGFGVCGDCAYQKYFAPSHWITEPMIVANITEDEIELSERLPADVDMPSMKNPQKDLQTMIVPYFVWDKIYTQFTGGIKAEQDLSGLNYVLTYHGMMKPQLDNAIEVAEGEYDIMFGAERYQAQVFKAENNQGYYLDAETVIPLTKKGKVRTMSGKPHTPRKLVKDKNITPKEAAKRMKLEAESFFAKKPTVFAMLEYLKYNPSNGVKGIEALPPGEYRVKRGEASKSKLYYGRELKELKEGDLISFVAIDRLHYDTNVAFDVPIYEYENNKIEYYDYDLRPTKRGQGRTKDAYFNNALFDSKTSELPLRDIPLDWVRIRGLGDASFYGHKFMQGFRKWISNAQNKKIVNDEYNRRFGKKLNTEEALMRKEMKAETFRLIDKDELMEHYVFYREDEEYNGNIPLNYEEWYEEFGDEIEYQIRNIYGAEGVRESKFEGNSAVIRQLNSQFRRLRFLGMLLGDDVKSLNDLNKKMDMTHPSLYVKNRSSDKSYLTWLTNEQITEELGLNKENLKQLHDEWGVKLGSKLQEMIFDLSYTIHDRMTSKQTHLDAETFDVEFDDWAEQEMLTHGKTVSFKEWAKEEGKKHGDMDLTDWAEHEEESHDERYEAEVVQYDVLKGKPNEGGVEYAEYISIHDSVNEAEKEARRESKNIAEDEAIYVVEERFDDETLESKPSNLMFSIEKPLMEDEMSDNFEAEGKRDIPSLKSVGLLLGIGALGAYLAPQNIRNFFNNLNK
jgi:hypothetical protein